MATNRTAHARYAAGTSAGGRFAPQPRTEADVALPAAPADTDIHPDSPGPEKWFDIPRDDYRGDVSPARLPTPTGQQSNDVIAGLIATRIRAGHALVSARRAHQVAPQIEKTRELLRRAEEAVKVAAATLEAATAPRMEQS